MNDQWTNRLSAYLDGELDSTERASLEAHLATCGHCYATLGELRQVVARAKSLSDTPPATDLWPNIRARLTQGSETRRHAPGSRRFSLTVGQLLAASVALMLVSGSGVWLVVKQQPANPAGSVAERERRFEPRIDPAGWTRSTDAAIADLQAALDQNEKRLDTATVRIVRKNLAVIDRAIAEARMALRSDPGNTYLNLHLANTMRRKVELLRRVNDMAATRS